MNPLDLRRRPPRPRQDADAASMSFAVDSDGMSTMLAPVLATTSGRF